MATEFTTKAQFPVRPERIYRAWLDSKEHAGMTGGEASASNKEGESFSAWDGYISGENLELEPESRIVQSWRTTEFAEGDTDSRIEITLSATERGCELVLVHSNIPEGQPDYEKGWDEHYFTPMKAYFS